MVVTVRVLPWTPPPHFSEQVEKPDQPERVQSTGQAKVLQLAVDTVLPQALPPYLAGVVVLRVRVLEPVPQDLEQAPKVDQAPWTQSMGQGWALHVRDCA